MGGSGRGEVLIETLSNGLKVAYRHVPGVVECCGMAIMAGSRDERDGEFGLAHFVEHTIFKGTARRRSHHVINRMENVGGELNAYTTKEETFVYALAPAHNTARAVELIADLVVNCSFPEPELEKEREVVADEISCYLDAPDAAVYDDFEDKIYSGSQLGHNILGSKKSVSRLSRADCRSWVERNYHAGRMIFFYTGSASSSRVFDLARRYLGNVPSGGDVAHRVAPAQVPLFDMSQSIRSHQAHSIVGVRIDDVSSAGYDVLALVNNILGGPGMNSWLNIALRERRGLVYTVESSVSRYCDTGLWTVYFGCDDEHTSLCKNLIKSELERMSCGAMTARSLNMAKRQFLGQMALSRAGVENSALALGRCVLRGEPFRTIDTVKTHFDSISPGDVAAMATHLIESGISSLTFH